MGWGACCRGVRTYALITYLCFLECPSILTHVRTYVRLLSWRGDGVPRAHPIVRYLLTYVLTYARVNAHLRADVRMLPRLSEYMSVRLLSWRGDGVPRTHQVLRTVPEKREVNQRKERSQSWCRQTHSSRLVYHANSITTTRPQSAGHAATSARIEPCSLPMVCRSAQDGQR
jgi:hypothetical protein